MNSARAPLLKAAAAALAAYGPLVAATPTGLNAKVYQGFVPAWHGEDYAAAPAVVLPSPAQFESAVGDKDGRLPSVVLTARCWGGSDVVALLVSEAVQARLLSALAVDGWTVYAAALASALPVPTPADAQRAKTWGQEVAVRYTLQPA